MAGFFKDSSYIDRCQDPFLSHISGRMVIAQITDIHISPDLLPVHNVDVAANFQRILNSISKDDAITHVVVTGDLCFEDGRISTMQWVKQRLDDFGLPYFVIPGNHDDSIIMAQVFDLDANLHGDELYYHHVIEPWNLIFLDTSKGTMSVDQQSWLMAIDSIHQQQSIIFMHHPPVDAVPYMDLNHALADKREVQRTLKTLLHARGIFCGHYHVGKTVVKEGMPSVYITPSTFFQLDASTAAFGIASYDIGWQRIDCSNKKPEACLIWLPTEKISD